MLVLKTGNLIFIHGTGINNLGMTPKHKVGDSPRAILGMVYPPKKTAASQSYYGNLIRLKV